MWEDHGEPETFMEALAKEDWTLSQVLAPLDGFNRGEYLHNLYRAAYREGRDEQAAKLFKTICAFLTGRLAREGVATVCPAEYLGRLGTSFWALQPVNGAMIKTHTAHLEAVFSGLGASVEDDESAKVCMRFLVDVYKERHGLRDVILDGVRKATGKGTKLSRIIALLSSCPQGELLRIVVNGLVRNSGDDAFVKALEVVSMLEGCTSEAFRHLRHRAEVVRGFDECVRHLVQRLTSFAPNICSKVEVHHSYAFGNGCNLELVVRVGPRSNGSNFQRDYEAIRNEMVKTIQRWHAQNNGRNWTVKLTFIVTDTDGKEEVWSDRDREVIAR